MKLVEREVLEPRPAQAASYNSRRGITASAQKLNLRDRNEMQDYANQKTATKEWQDKAWIHFDKIGEVKFAFGLVASVMSRVRLYPAAVVNPDAPPVRLTDAVTIERPEEEAEDGRQTKSALGVDIEDAVTARDMFQKALGPSDVPGILRSFALNTNIPGECYLAEIDGRWQLKSTSELQVMTGGEVKLFRAAGGIPRDLDKKTPIGRVWREHPRHSFEADSSMKGVSDDCDELILLGRVIRSNSRARLNAGIAFIADEISMMSSTATDDQETEEDEENQFEKDFADAIAATVEHEDAANTVIPILVRGPAELGEKAIQHVTFDRPIDEFLVTRADRTLERILQGIDVPKDVVTGLANVKYSNAIQIDESLYKAHVEPLCLMICDAITDIILRPLLRAAGMDPDDAAKFVVWYDPSEVTVRPDRANDAQKLYDAKELSGAALRQAYGYSEAEKPSEEELAARMVLDSVLPPEILNVLIQHVFPTVLKKTSAAGTADEELPDELKQTLDATDTPGEPTLDPTVGE